MRKMIFMAVLALAGCDEPMSEGNEVGVEAAAMPPATHEQLCQSARSARDASLGVEPESARRWAKVVNEQCARAEDH